VQTQIRSEAGDPGPIQEESERSADSLVRVRRRFLGKDRADMAVRAPCLIRPAGAARELRSERNELVCSDGHANGEEFVGSSNRASARQQPLLSAHASLK